MRVRIFIPIIFLLFSCKKELSTTSVADKNENVVVESEISVDGNNYSRQSSFSLEGARVYEKAGRKEEVAELLDYLSYFNLISYANYTHFYKLNETDSLKSNFEIVKSLNKTYSFRTDSLKNDFPKYYLTLFQNLNKKHNLNLQNIKIVSDTTQSESQTAILSFNHSGKNYSATIQKQEEAEAPDPNFYKILNNVLGNIRDSSRYYLFKNILVFETDSNVYYGSSTTDFTLAKLKEVEAYAFHQFPNVVDLSYEEHRFPLSEGQFKTAWATLDSVKFFSHLPLEKVEEIKSSLQDKTIYDVRDILFYGEPLRICVSPYTTNFQQPYKQVLETLKEYSNGSFEPTNISDNSLPNENAEISFTLNEKKYSGTFQNGIDRIDISGLLELVNMGLNDQNIDGNFYLLNNPDSKSCYIFMNENSVNTLNTLLSQN